MKITRIISLMIAIFLGNSVFAAQQQQQHVSAPGQRQQQQHAAPSGHTITRALSLDSALGHTNTRTTPTPAHAATPAAAHPVSSAPATQQQHGSASGHETTQTTNPAPAAAHPAAPAHTIVPASAHHDITKEEREMLAKAMSIYI